MMSNNPFNQHVIVTGTANTTRNSSAFKDLEIAIATFQAILTDDDRKELQKLKKTSHDAQSIIEFTVDLDKVDIGRRGKSIASRLASFLQTIQQFAPIIDTYIQSNPEITALIWGSIKLTFMFLANFTSYFQSFVELLHGFGSLCTRFAEYQAIFSDSARLKGPICQFHTAIIRCCEKIFVVIRRPLISQLVSALTKSFQSEIQSHVEDIRTRAENVQRDIELVKAHADRYEQNLQVVERKEASDHRQRWVGWASNHTAVIKSFQSSNKTTALRQKRHGLLQDLSTFNFTSTFNSQRSKRHLRTAEWIFQTREFEEWSMDKGPHVIHITGKIGSGKTVLASSVIERLCRIRLPSRFTSFVFIRFDDEQSLKADTVIRSCVQQVLTALSHGQLSHKSAAEIKTALEEAKSTMYSDESLTKLYSLVSFFVKNWYIVLDGLDECDSRQQADILKFFAKLLNSNEKAPRLMLCSRETSSAKIGQAFPNCLPLMTGLNQTSRDIQTYAEDIIKAKLEAGELVVRDQKIVTEILETIISKEQGMFLWAFLAIEDICSKTSDKGIRKALEEIPTDLPATFDRALGRIMKKGNQEIAKKTFAWIEAVLHPLTLPQLQEALSIEIGQRTLQQDDRINGITRLTRWCECFIEVEETDDTVHFNHHSIREFLLMPGAGDLQELHIEEEKCHQLVGEACITYITFDDFQKGLTQSVPVAETTTFNIDMRELAAQTVQTAVKGDIESRLTRLVRHVPKSGHSNKDLATEGLTSYLTKSQPLLSPELTNYPFLAYAKENWFKHTLYLDSVVNNTTWVFLGKILSGNIPYSQNVPWEDPTWEQKASETYPYLMQHEGFFLGDFDRRFVSVFTYGYQHDNRGLCCRAFMLLAEVCKSKEYLKSKLRSLAVAKNHKDCKNGCLSLVQPELGHSSFADMVTAAIAGGISYIPASRKPYTKERYNPRNSHYPELLEDICIVLNSGYRRGEHPNLELFAALAIELRQTQPLSADLFFSKYHVTNDELFATRTSCSRSVYDIIAGCVLSGNNVRVRNFYDSQGEEAQKSKSHNIRSALCVIDLMQSLSDADKVEQRQDDKIGASATLMMRYNHIIHFHPTTIERIFDLVIIPCWRPRKVLEALVAAFFGEHIHTALQSTHEAIFRKSVSRNNWELASCLIRLQPSSVAGPSHSNVFDYIKEALRCPTCCLDLSPRTTAAYHDTVDDFFKPCNKHWTILSALVDEESLDMDSHSIKTPKLRIPIGYSRIIKISDKEM